MPSDRSVPANWPEPLRESQLSFFNHFLTNEANQSRNSRVYFTATSTVPTLFLVSSRMKSIRSHDFLISSGSRGSPLINLAMSSSTCCFVTSVVMDSVDMYRLSADLARTSTEICHVYNPPETDVNGDGLRTLQVRRPSRC